MQTSKHVVDDFALMAARARRRMAATGSVDYAAVAAQNPDTEAPQEAFDQYAQGREGNVVMHPSAAEATLGHAAVAQEVPGGATILQFPAKK